MDPYIERDQHLTRRHFFGRASAGLGTIALASLLDRDLFAGGSRWTSSRCGRGHRGVPQLRSQSAGG